jgi:hypothetical protein
MGKLIAIALVEPTRFLGPALASLAMTELYFWHLRGALCFVLVVSAIIAHFTFGRDITKTPTAEISSRVCDYLRAMRKNLTNDDEQLEGVIALLDATRSASSDRIERANEIVLERGVHVVCEALVQHSDSSRFVVPAYQLLYRLLLIESAKKPIIEAFNVDSLMGSVLAPMAVAVGNLQRAKKEMPPDPTLLTKGFTVISTLVDAHTAMQDGAMELRVPKLLTRALDQYCKFPGALAQFAPTGVRCLFNLCYRHPDSKFQFAIETDGLSVLLRVMTLLPLVQEVQLHGVGLLYDCLSEMRDADLIKLHRFAIDLNILEILGDARQHFSGVQAIVDSATQMEAVLAKLVGKAATARNRTGLAVDALCSTFDRVD